MKAMEADFMARVRSLIAEVTKQKEKMQPYTVFPDKTIVDKGPMAHTFLGMGIDSFHDACRYVHELPYGYNSDRDDT